MLELSSDQAPPPRGSRPIRPRHCKAPPLHGSLQSIQERPNLSQGLLGNGGQQPPGTRTDVEHALQSPEGSARPGDEPPSPDPALPQGMRTVAQASGGREPGRPAAGARRAPPSVASGAASLSSVPGTPLPHPDSGSKSAFSLSLRALKVRDSPPKLPLDPETQIRTHRSKTTMLRSSSRDYVS